MIIGNPMGGVGGGMNTDGGGVIMVDTLNLKKKSAKQAKKQVKETPPIELSRKQKKKMNRGKNIPLVFSPPLESARKIEKDVTKMVTLRNPMFHNVNDQLFQQPPPPLFNPNRPPPNMPQQHQQQHHHQQQSHGNSGGGGVGNVSLDQPAAIIKNDNGMFTIRNPALHQAIQSGAVKTPTRTFNPTTLETNNSFSFFSDSAGLDTSISSTYETERKLQSAIGSEMRTAQQQQQWNAQTGGIITNSANICDNYTGGNQFRSYSPFETQFPFNNSDFTRKSSPIPRASPKLPGVLNSFGESLFNNGGGGGAAGPGGGVETMSHHSSTSSTPSLMHHHQHQHHHNHILQPSVVRGGGVGVVGGGHPSVMSGVGPSRSNHQGGNYFVDNSQYNVDNAGFYKSLQPGQRLNSEVTIHNISESKFLQPNQQNCGNLGGNLNNSTSSTSATTNHSNGVEITKINKNVSSTPEKKKAQSNNSSSSSLTSSSTSSSLSSSSASSSSAVVGNNSSVTISSSSSLLNRNGITTGNGIGIESKLIKPISSDHNNPVDSIFVPNQKVNLNELESCERDIESFKRFNYYFEPPKNKPKVNLNLNDIVVNKTTTTTTMTTIPTLTAAAVTTMVTGRSHHNHHHGGGVDDYHHNGGVGQNNSNSLTVHGIIGSEMKMLHGHIG